MLVHL